MIPDGYSIIPPGKIVSVVTYLEMREPPMTTAVADARWVLRRHSRPDLGWYRELFRAVGQEWLWFSRLQMDDSALQAVIWNSNVDVFSLDVNGRSKGILELDRRDMPDIELAFIGVTPDLIGQGAGTFLLSHALDS